LSNPSDNENTTGPPREIPEWLFVLIQCPVTGTPLAKADPDLVSSLQMLAKAGKLRSKNGVSVSEIPSQGLVGGGRWFYPVQNGIPSLIPGEAIEIRKQ
jgi:uncharacterized protein YbaR (Trm112 family)